MNRTNNSPPKAKYNGLPLEKSLSVQNQNFLVVKDSQPTTEINRTLLQSFINSTFPHKCSAKPKTVFCINDKEKASA